MLGVIPDHHGAVRQRPAARISVTASLRPRETETIGQTITLGRGIMSLVSRFPSMKADALLAVLRRKPLGYEIVRQKGSHRMLESDGRLPVLFSFHSGATVPPGVVRKILVERAGLDEDEALRVLRGKRTR
jgi:predicted RNA binding protein YcfA (HicA-like mRNA interferase family)